MEKQELFNCIVNVIKNGSAEDEDIRQWYFESVDENTRLFGGSGGLDSLGVVVLLSELEEVLSDDYDIDVSLANDQAMSRTTSPFRTVDTLVNYVYGIINN